MRLSHSKLNALIHCPLSYKLSYKLGIWKKEEKKVFKIGSAVHYGIEHNTSDLSSFFNDNGTFHQQNEYTYEQLLSESMVTGYLKHKDVIFADLLKDLETGEQLELLDETHELRITGTLKSNIAGNPGFGFLGIIDLLLLTNKGWIVIDYKTSSRQPDWNSYIEQMYRYVFLLQDVFPEVPVYKLAIINLRKVGIRQKKNETEFSFRQRLALEYELNEEAYINHHVYEPEKLDKDEMAFYMNNLSDMADFARNIEDNEMYYLNYGGLVTQYGRADYYDIFKGTPDAHVLYYIRDIVYDEYENEIKDFRDCREIDLLAIKKPNVLHKFEQFKLQAVALFAVNSNVDKDVLFNHLRQSFTVDEDLMEIHWNTLQYEVEQSIILESEDTEQDESDEE